MSVLAAILDGKRREIERLHGTPRAPRPRPTLDVLGALRRAPRPRTGLRLIAEVKLRSPSAGPLSQLLSPSARTLAYARAGASMVSVLCDGPSFGGSWDHLAEARAALDAAGLPVPLLAKEFVLDARQLVEARDRGADAVLLIARIVDRDALTALVLAAHQLELEPLVEVTTASELEAAGAAGARLVGVNARDLDSLAMDPARTARVLAAIEPTVVSVYLSGLATPDDVARVARGPAHAALVGEALMRRDDPGQLLAQMVAAAAD